MRREGESLDANGEYWRDYWLHLVNGTSPDGMLLLAEWGPLATTLRVSLTDICAVGLFAALSRG